MDQMDLFQEQRSMSAPLASRLRPLGLDDMVGQSHLIGKGKILRQMIERDEISSMIFWGPPGVGKTTLARIIANSTHSDFVDFSAVTSGIKEIREVMGKAEMSRQMGVRTVLFVDEIHRFNKAQQDAFLPYVEKGSIILIGATTENPSFEINSALLSRCRVFVLKELQEEDMMELLERALRHPDGFAGQDVRITPRQLHIIARFANGDARTALGTLEMTVLNGELAEDASVTVTDDILLQVTDRRSLLYDKSGDGHYDMISALHKSMRNSDPDAALYYLRRMLQGGEEPLYIARRLIRFASEDVGMADSAALPLAVSVYQACHFNGMPECDVNLAHAVVYLSMAPKSNALYRACLETDKDVKQSPAEPVPLHLRNAVTDLMAELDYGKGYEYAHEAENKLTKMTCLPESLAGKSYYLPTDQGREKAIKERLEEIRSWKELP
ncbi:MAG: replication-associated recombination protein A [Lachnospiraceae bacterium]|nr:replication-associated recombination protein A [Lachnospiraceae bacterium]